MIAATEASSSAPKISPEMKEGALLARGALGFSN
jgi:hypothetical protein